MVAGNVTSKQHLSLGLAINLSTMASGPWNLLSCYVTHHRPPCRADRNATERSERLAWNINTGCNFNERGDAAHGAAAWRAEFQRFINLWKLVPLIGNEIVPGPFYKQGKTLRPLEANFLNYSVRVTAAPGVSGCLFMHNLFMHGIMIFKRASPP